MRFGARPVSSQQPAWEDRLFDPFAPAATYPNDHATKEELAGMLDGVRLNLCRRGKASRLADEWPNLLRIRPQHYL